jgi:hypothetical protein
VSFILTLASKWGCDITTTMISSKNFFPFSHSNDNGDAKGEIAFNLDPFAFANFESPSDSYCFTNLEFPSFPSIFLNLKPYSLYHLDLHLLFSKKLKI